VDSPYPPDARRCPTTNDVPVSGDDDRGRPDRGVAATVAMLARGVFGLFGLRLGQVMHGMSHGAWDRHHAWGVPSAWGDHRRGFAWGLCACMGVSIRTSTHTVTWGDSADMRGPICWHSREFPPLMGVLIHEGCAHP